MESFYTSKKLKAANGLEVEIGYDAQGSVRSFIFRENDSDSWIDATVPEAMFQAVEMARHDFAASNVCFDHGLISSSVCSICAGLNFDTEPGP